MNKLKRIVQIENNKAHWIFESAEIPQFAPGIILKDITGKGDIQEGWDYDSSTDEFTEPIYKPILPIPPKPLEPSEAEILNKKIEALEKENADLLLDSAMKDIRINQNEKDIADLLLIGGGI